MGMPGPAGGEELGVGVVAGVAEGAALATTAER